MKDLAGVILAFFDLAEAEGRVLQARVLHTVRSCLWFALGVLFLGIALGFFLASGFDWLLTVISRPAALALTGLGSILIAFIFLVSSTLCLKKVKKNPQSSKESAKASIRK